MFLRDEEYWRVKVKLDASAKKVVCIENWL
jgi:hypothetical protein